MIIGLDMMGGDYAPLEAVKGIHLFKAESSSNVALVLIGDEVPLFDLPRIPRFVMDHQLKLPALHSLIASHRSCAS